MRLSRRAMLVSLGACAGLAAAVALGRRRGSVTAGRCPAVAGRPIRWIVPYGVGGGYDAESRLIQPFLSSELGTTIAVENQGGAGGIVGARAIASAPPDGRTLGILGAPGLLVAALVGQAGVPDPARDFTILGRAGRSFHVWAAGARSPVRTLEGVLAESQRRPLVFAVNEAGSANVVSIAGAASILDVRAELVAGFSGARAASLAAVRGDVDLVSFDFETIRDLLRAGDLSPVLQISASPIAADPLLDAVPLLGGADGWAERRAKAGNADPARSRALTTALIDVIGAGRLIVAPPALAPELAGCLSQAVFAALTGAARRGAAVRDLDPAPAAVARATVEAAAQAAPGLLPVVADAIRRMRR